MVSQEMHSSLMATATFSGARVGSDELTRTIWMATATVWQPSQLAYEIAMLVSSMTESMVRWMSKANRKTDEPSSLLMATAELSSAARAGAPSARTSVSATRGTSSICFELFKSLLVLRMRTRYPGRPRVQTVRAE